MRAVYDQGSQAALAPITPRIDFNALHSEGIFVNPFERGETRPIPRCVPDGARRAREQASRLALSVRQVEALDQGQEPEASRFQSRAGSSTPRLGRVARMKIRVILEVFQRQARMMLGFLVAGLRDLLDGKDQRLNGTF